VSPRRALPRGIRGRGSVFTYTWRDAAGRQYCRKAGNTLTEAEAFKRRIDDQLALGTYAPASTMTFGAYATGWIETWPLKDSTRERYRGILRRAVLPEFGGYPLAKIHPHHVRSWVADLRHTAASLLLAYSGAELAELKFILGHSQIAHTVDLYGHLVPGRLEGLRATFDAAVNAAQQQSVEPSPAAASQVGPPRLRLVT